MQTAERSSGLDPSESVIFNRCLFAYKASAQWVKGDIIELGSGEGYGIKELAPLASRYLAIDKFDSFVPSADHIEFRKLMLPYLSGIEDNSFDFAVTFQVVEHIKNDKEFVKEIHRVLKPGGKLLMSTPNRLMSLTRNPWHIREYTAAELTMLLKSVFADVEMRGVYGSQKVMDYHARNKSSVEKITRFDILRLQYILPRQLLQIPYDMMNRLNRRKLLTNNTSLVSEVSTSDFYLGDSLDTAFDLFAVSTK
ncbi:MAG: class I SAM-dependent methyltransferase [Bacteroidetes bacterium]|nr:class I SAM-dependent methyltransferase [Bacteroidota bacterium]